MPDWLPLLAFALAGSITPGPNVLMIAAASAGHGIRPVLPHMIGVTVGFGAMILLVGLGMAGPLAASPALHATLRWAGAAWLLWLAWKIATAPPPDSPEARPPLGFIGAALFQWVNPKAWMLTAAAVATYTTAAAPLLPQVVGIGAIFFVVQMPCLLAWAALGAGTARLLRTPAAMRRFNLAMGLLLAASVLPLLL